jgi:hypothetical protein
MADVKSSWNLGDWLGNVHNWFVGGDASSALPKGPQQYNAVTGQLGQIAAGAPNRQAPQTQAYQLDPAAQLAGGQMDQSRGGAMGVANNLGAIASGQQAGAGELAVNRQVSQATAAQAAAAHMARGANAALAYRSAARNTADIGMAGAGQAAQAQMADQQAALGQQGQLYGAMYGQDANVAAQNAQLQQQAMLQQGTFGQQAALANQQAQLAQTSLNDQARIQALGQQLGWDQATIDAQLKGAEVKSADKGILAGIFKGISDERLKTDIADGGKDADELMSSLGGAKKYRYRDEERWGRGMRLGFMAQDLEKSKMGRAVMVKVDDKLGFDIGKAASAALASVARLHERLSAVEGKSK